MKTRELHRGPGVVLVLVLLIVLAAGGGFYRYERRTLHRAVEQHLEAIGRLKAEQIAAWLEERLDEGAELMERPVLGRLLTRILTRPAPGDREAALAELEAIRRHDNFADILVLDPSGRLRLSLSGGAEAHEGVPRAVAAALGGRRPILMDLHTGTTDPTPHITVVAPIFSQGGGAGDPLGAVLLVAEARRFLYPMIQSWPVPSETAETLLVRRDGDDVLFLNDLRHRQGAALSLRIPMTQTTVPAVQAVLGKTGVLQGADYRGVEVVSTLHAVPGSFALAASGAASRPGGWFLVSKVDAAEAFAPWHREAGLILALLASLVACTAAAGLVLWQRTEKAHYRTLYRTEQARRQAEAAHRTTLLSIGDAVIVTDPEGRVALLNPPAETLTGWPSAEAAGRPLAEIFRIANERTGEPVEDPVARVRREGVVVGLANHTVLIARDGTERPIADSAAPIRDGEGALAGAVLVFRDQTEERAARRAVEAARQELQALFDITPALICLVDRERKVVRANRAFDEARGAHDQARDRRACGILGCLHALDDPRRCGIGPHCMDCALQLALADTLATGATHRHVEFSTVLERQGKPEEIAFLGSTCRFPSDGSPRALLYLVDITTHKQAEADREKLREQLTQAQKMEAIGRLAGGIAHDFNNLLMGILNYLELCRDGLSPDHPIRPYLDEIRQDAERSTALVRQLMTFARKQPTSPAVLDLNQAVAGALGWLRRLIGEQIELAWHPGEALGRVALDPAQLDQLLTNLLANARDAIGGPGTVTIETQNAVLDAAYCARYPGRAPGEYVVLAVTDNGRGMDAETKRRVFEPYFTTKAAGQGGGLGLATVDGIVQQNGGIVTVYSEPDRGATFRLYFPRCQDPASPRPHPALREIPRGRGELVLLVEDERAVRLTCHRFLEDLGYRVLAAATPAEALALAEESAGPLHLLLTDVVLPELTGRALAADLLARHPGLRTLYMSGYTANAIHHQGVLEPGIHFLQKPFTRADLAQKVREVLDEG